MKPIRIDEIRDGGYTLKIDTTPAELDLRGDPWTFEDSVRGTVIFSMIGNDVRGLGEVRAAATAACGRCLEPVRTELNVLIESFWIEQDSDEEERFHPTSESIMAEYHDGDSLDPTGPIREELIEALAPNPVCSEDCKGLCPGCGANLNTEPCRCDPKASAPEMPEWKRKILELKRSGGGE